MYNSGGEIEKELSIKKYENIYDDIVDFEEEEVFLKEIEANAKAEAEDGKDINPKIDLERYYSEKNRLESEIEEMGNYLQKMVADAKIEAEAMKSKAYESGAKEGYDAGYENGYSAGYQESQQIVENTLKAEADNLLKELKDLILSTSQSKRKVLDDYKDDLKDIAIAIAEKVIHVSLKSSGDVIKRMIVSATEGIMSKDWVKIYIAKCDAEMVVDGDTELISSLSKLSDHIKIILMDNEASGTCIVELPDKVIDASVNTQIENIKEIISSSRI